MRITIKFPNASRAFIQGRTRDSVSLADLKRLWEAERAINELTTLRCHIQIDEEPNEEANPHS